MGPRHKLLLIICICIFWTLIISVIFSLIFRISPLLFHWRVPTMSFSHFLNFPCQHISVPCLFVNYYIFIRYWSLNCDQFVTTTSILGSALCAYSALVLFEILFDLWFQGTFFGFIQDLLERVATTWMNVSLRMKHDEETDKTFGWVLEMWDNC